MNVSLLPADPNKRSILAQLNDSLELATNLYASVCFWSIGPGVLSHHLERVLAQPGSFCIADIHCPTNVDKLNEFYDMGVTRLYLFFKEIQPKKLEAHLQRHLLHTKMLLIDLPDNRAELWVGSHNFTKQALKGINREATLVIPCYKDDVLYTQAQRYFSSILQDPDCRQFDPDLLDTYKELQGLPKEEVESGPFILPLAWDSTEWPAPATLAQQLILLVGHNPDERRQFATIGDDVPLAIRAHDLATGRISYFSATSYGANAIDPNDPDSYDIQFSQRHLAVRNQTQLPFIAHVGQAHSRETLRQFRYHVSIRILDELPANLQFADEASPAEAKWQTDYDTNALLAHTDIRSDSSEANDGTYRTASPRNLAQKLEATSTIASNANSPEEFAQAVKARVDIWLQYARHRRYRAIPTEPKAVRVKFFHEVEFKHLPDAFAVLDEEFQPANLPALRADFEQPLREVYYRDDAQQLQAPDSTQGPQVRKLLKRYRLR